MYRLLDLIDLHDRIKSGDENAEVELYWWLQDHRGLLCGRQRTSRSEDVASYVWISLIPYIRRGGVKEPRALITLAETIAYRHRKQYEYKESRYVELCIGLAKADPALTAPELIWQNEIRRQVNEAIDTLTPRKKEIIHRYLNGQSPDEIAEEMALTDTQVRLSKNRAIEDIRKQLCIKRSTRKYHRRANDDNNNTYY